MHVLCVCVCVFVWVVYLCGWVSVCDGSRDQGVDSVLGFLWNSVVSAGTPLTSNTIIKTKEADISSSPQDIIKDYTGSRVRDKQMNQNGCVEDSMEEGQCSLDAFCSETNLLRVTVKGLCAVAQAFLPVFGRNQREELLA